jgi:hypothetical protein
VRARGGINFFANAVEAADATRVTRRRARIARGLARALINCLRAHISRGRARQQDSICADTGISHSAAFISDRLESNPRAGGPSAPAGRNLHGPLRRSFLFPPRTRRATADVCLSFRLLLFVDGCAPPTQQPFLWGHRRRRVPTSRRDSCTTPSAWARVSPPASQSVSLWEGASGRLDICCRRR